MKDHSSIPAIRVILLTNAERIPSDKNIVGAGQLIHFADKDSERGGDHV
jgi:hypothetical protein